MVLLSPISRNVRETRFTRPLTVSSHGIREHVENLSQKPVEPASNFTVSLSLVLEHEWSVFGGFVSVSSFPVRRANFLPNKHLG